MSFDVLAAHYRWMELVLAGGKLQRCRTAFLGQVSHRQNALLVGEGNGRFLVDCRRRLAHARITCVDASARMLTSARRRLEKAPLSLDKVELIHADALGWQAPKGKFDLIVTHFFLDCFRPEQLREVIKLLATAGTSDASWLLADFHIPPAGFRRSRALIIHWLMYCFFRVVTGLPGKCLSVPDAWLEECGFKLEARKLSDWGLLHSDRWERNRPQEIRMRASV